ncbi:hypothetical protein J2T57_003204 [Natronocella acetinitrilica]|uniref:Uncharacterized protein n=1 Tax=Natronocella acetinitrilica TaxID=414046 RepID=A0AAE3G540_9GAMM|nr:hypothetical protein [Natronocella acetinitrilica]
MAWMAASGNGGRVRRSKTRREPIPGGSYARSLLHTVSERRTRPPFVPWPWGAIATSVVVRYGLWPNAPYGRPCPL